MPTVLLLDQSLSMKRTVSSDDKLQTRLRLAKDGLTAFLTYMENIFPLEPVALLTFSSSCDIIVPFTRDHSEIKESLEQISFGDKTDLPSAIDSVIEMIVREWGVFNPVQILLITDGMPGVDQRNSILCAPFPCKLHITVIAKKSEFEHSVQNLGFICQMTNTQPERLVFPVGSELNSNSVREMFLQLCTTHYKPVTSSLKCGHLESRITYSPSPLMVQSFHDIATNQKHVFDNPYTIAEFASEINICGFLDVDCLSAPPVYSKHFVIDADPDCSKADKIVSLLLENQPFEDEKPQEADKPSFRVLLHGSLKCESKVALVRLGPDWFGFLSSAAASFKKSNLILTVLFPKARLPWMGSLHYLGPKPPAKDPRISDTATRSKDVFPVSLPHVFSYQLGPGNLHWAKEPVLHADLAKVLRYSHKLPEKESSFVKELNKLRVMVFTYSIPSVIDKVCQILSTEVSSSSNPQAKAIIERSIHFLSTNHNPHEKLILSTNK